MALCGDLHLDQHDHKPTAIEFANDASGRLDAATSTTATSPAPEMLDTPSGVADALHGSTSTAKIFLVQYSGQDQRDHKPATIEFTSHADTRRIAYVHTLPSRDASPTPNMYHPS